VLSPSFADTADRVFCAPFCWRAGAHRGQYGASTPVEALRSSRAITVDLARSDAAVKVPTAGSM
jgi:hypothetical protein